MRRGAVRVLVPSDDRGWVRDAPMRRLGRESKADRRVSYHPTARFLGPTALAPGGIRVPLPARAYTELRESMSEYEYPRARCQEWCFPLDAVTRP